MLIFHTFFSDDGVNKECFTKSTKDLELSKQSQVPCSSKESNNNTNDLNKVIFSHLYNNSSQNDLNLLDVTPKETDGIINKKETISFQNHKHVQTVSNHNHTEIETTNALNIENNFIVTTHTSLNVNDDEDDFKTTEAIMSLALKAGQDIQFNSSDDFETENLSDENIGAGFQINNSLMIQNGIIHDSLTEEEYQINNSLKILESLVNIEHDKLEVQKCMDIKEEFPQHKNSSNEKKQGKISDKTIVKKSENQRSKEKLHQILDKEEISYGMKRKIKQLENHDKSKKIKKHKYKSSNKSKKVSKLSNDMNNLTLSTSSSIPVVQSDQNNKLSENGTLCSSVLKTFEGGITTILKDVQISDTSVKSLLPSQTKKDNVLSKELQIQHYSTGNSTSNEEYLVSANNSNTLQIKTHPTHSINNDRSMENSKTKSLNQSGLTMKTSDYKKLYEKDRKRLFNPDIIIRSSISKDSVINHCIKSDNNQIEKKDNCVVNKKSKIQEFKTQLENLSAKKNIPKRRNGLKVKITKPNTANNKKTISEDTLNGLDQKSSCSTIVKNSHHKCKKGKIKEKITYKNKKNVGINKNEDSRITKFSENINTEENLEINTGNNLQNSNTLVDNSMPDWLKAKCIQYNIKPSHVVLERFDLSLVNNCFIKNVKNN